MDLKLISILTDDSLLKHYVDINNKLCTVDQGGRAYRRLCKDEELMRYEILRRMGGK
ncbi:MAG: hypothetical protein J6V44_05490 [Methanobrevibacter sp.]|nr:hypothetical protein [Methanobrevibacter sp.]MBO7696029.1 hypothetical protein [Methanobrevibacter sp.]